MGMRRRSSCSSMQMATSGPSPFAASVLMRTTLSASSTSSSSEAGSDDPLVGVAAGARDRDRLGSESSSSSASAKVSRQHRRYLNRLALYLPRPLKPIAHSSARLIFTLAGSLTVFLLLFFSLFSSTIISQSSLTPLQPSQDVRPSNGIPTSTPVLLDRIKRQGQYPLAQSDSDSDGIPIKRENSLVKEDNSNPKVLDNHETDNGIRSPESIIPKTTPAKTEDNQVCGLRGCDPEGYVKGAETFASIGAMPMFRDNLLKDRKYLTFGMMNGFSSQFLAAANGMYLSKLTDRIAILPPFGPSANMDRHVAGYLGFSKIFDLHRLESLIRHPIQDWQNLKISAEQVSSLGLPINPEFEDEKLRGKKVSSVKRENLSCWSLWAAQMPSPGKPAGSVVQNHLGLDIDYWQAPLHYAKPPNDRHIRYWDLVLHDYDIDNVASAQLAKVAKKKRKNLEAQGISVRGMEMPKIPDDQLLCFDTLYYTAATGPLEWWQPHAPVWKAIGRFAHWQPDVAALAEKTIRKLLLTEPETSLRTPEFISVHIRRQDFQKKCSASSSSSSSSTSNCLPSLETYKRSISRIRNELLESKGSYVKAVIVTTDETDSKYLKEIEKMGWKLVDHSKLQTATEHGSVWWPIVLDAAILSRGSGFVGTEKSTMSLLAGKRVEEWNHGRWELVTLEMSASH